MDTARLFDPNITFSTSIFSSPNAEKKLIHWVKRKWSAIRSLFRLFRLFLSRLQWILKSGCWSVSIHKQTPSSGASVLVSKAEALQGKFLREHDGNFSQWKCATIRDSWFLLLITTQYITMLLAAFSLLYSSLSFACALAYTRSLLNWMEPHKEANIIE